MNVIKEISFSGLKALAKETPDKKVGVEVLIHGYYGDKDSYEVYRKNMVGTSLYVEPKTIGLYDGTTGQIEFVSKEHGLEHKLFLPYSSEYAGAFRLLSEPATRRVKKGIEAYFKKHPESLIMRATGYLLGADPEIFVLDKNNEVVPAWTFLPKQVKGSYCSIFWDGPQAEFNVEPRTCLEQLCEKYRSQLVALWRKVKNANPEYHLSTCGVVTMPPDVLQNADMEFIELGCAPSKNAYDDPSLQINVESPRELPIRFAGAHMHFSTKSQGIERTGNKGLVKVLDSMLGVCMTSLFEGLEDPRRRQYYGVSGEYRDTDYGVEYRVPPSAMLANPICVHICYEIARSAIYCYRMGLDKYWKAGEEEIKQVINKSDVPLARKILARNKPFAEALLSVPVRAYYGSWSKTVETGIKKAVACLFNGAKEHIATADSEIVRNWGLNNTVRTPHPYYNIGNLK